MSSVKSGEQKKPSVKWSADNITVFLECYVNYDLLWNIRHADYVNKNKRESAMLKLQNDLVSLGLQVPDIGFLRARIKAIKSTYRGELLKVNESKTSGAGTDEVYKPKLPWFAAADLFMRDVVITRQPKTNLEVSETCQTSIEDEDQDNTQLDLDSCDAVDDQQEVQESAQTAVQSTQMTAGPYKKRRLSKLSKVEGAIEKLQKLTENRPRPSTSFAPMDEVGAFGKYVSAQIRDLPLVDRLRLQDKIQTLISRERLKLLEGPSRQSPMISGSSSNYSHASEDERSDNLITEYEYTYQEL